MSRRNCALRILYVTPTLPVPTGGGQTRPFNLIKQLSDRHEISVISFVQPAEGDLVGLLEPYCQRLELVPFEGFEPLGKWRNRLSGWGHLLFDDRPAYVRTFPVDRMRVPLRRLLASSTFDLVVFEQLFLAGLLGDIGDLPALLVEQNVESDIARQSFAQARNLVHKVRDWLAWRKLMAFERRCVQRFRACVAVSQRDAELVRAMSSGTQVYVVPNGVDSRYFATGDEKRGADRLLFFGTLSYGPNADGIRWFCQQVLPRIRQNRPGLRLDIVGPSAVREVVALGDIPGVNLVGFVGDVRPALWLAAVCIVPLRAGGGTRLKILEALAAHCPVVSTTIGAEGLDLVDGQDLLIADNPDDFAKAVLRLLDDGALRANLAAAGASAVRQRYDWQEIAAQFEFACIEAAR